MKINTSLGSKITLLALGIVTLGTIGVKLIVNPHINQNLSDQARQLAMESALRYSEEVKLVIDHAFRTVSIMADAVEGVRDAGVDDRRVVSAMLSRVLIENSNLLGTYTAFEPNAFDGKDAEYVNAVGHDSSGRFVPYYSRGADGKITLEALSGYDVEGKGDYYQIPMRTNQPAALDPYEYKVGDQDVLLTSFTVPLRNNSGKPVGIVGVDVGLSELSEIVADAKPMGDGIIGMLTSSGMWIAHPNKDWVGKNIKDTDPAYEEFMDDIRELKPVHTYGHSVALNTDIYRIILPFKVGVSNDIWAVAMVIPMDTVNGVMNDIRQLDFLSSVVLVLLLGTMLAFLTRSMLSVPMRNIVASVKRIQAGDFTSDVPYQTRADEVGVLGKALLSLRDNSAEAQEMRQQQEENERKANERQKAALNAMADTFEASVGQIVDTVVAAVGELQAAANSLAATAEETNSQATAVAAATTQTSTNVQTVAAAAEELSISIGEINRQVGDSTVAASQAVSAVAQTGEAVTQLADAANNIVNVVELIRAVAEQTNLLALNATIEAARAGDAGKGFAVVAGEVKALAGQTARATDDIGQRIMDMKTATDHAVSAIENIQASITKVEEISDYIAKAVSQQQEATFEISGNVQQASQGVDEVASNIVGVTQASGNVGAASTQMLQAATSLSDQARMLKEEVAQFIATVRG